MIKQWLRRRLAPHDDDMEQDEDEDQDRERERGALVRKGRLVALRAHVPANREAFQRWYADAEIARLLRHDLEPLTAIQSRGYFDTFILPASARGECFAIHERKGKRLIGTTALTDRARDKRGASALFRIVIGEKDCWGRGYGTEATRLVVEHAFTELDLAAVRLEVFQHNTRALAAYARVGFVMTGEHREWVPRRKTELHVLEMRLEREGYLETQQMASQPRRDEVDGDGVRERRRMREARAAARAERQSARASGRRRGDPPLPAEADAASGGDQD